MSTDPTSAPAPKVKNPGTNVYTVMLGISLFAICLACLFLFLEWNNYHREIIPGKPLF
ncbi:MAG: hypothetical protein K8R36_09215 [Planctomycetales bacterium]|nr:hypothetical protein [Planctomycetales bacterium]